MSIEVYVGKKRMEKLSAVVHDGTMTGDGSSEATALSVPVMAGASEGSTGSAGLAPAPGAGDGGKVLSGSGTWVDQPSRVSDLVNDGDGSTGSVLVKSSTVTQIVRVAALPETPDENTLYLIVEEAAATSDTEA